MSKKLQSAKVKLQGQATPILEHTCKCIIWGKSYQYYRHWIEDELANFLFQCAEACVDADPSEDAVADWIFRRPNSTTRSVIQRIYRKGTRKENPYPSVKLSYRMYANLDSIYEEFISTIPSILISSEVREIVDNEGLSEFRRYICPILYSILDKYC